MRAAERSNGDNAVDPKEISTEYQPKGSAGNPSDTLDRENENVAPGQRQWAADSKKKPNEEGKSAAEDPGSRGGTAGTGGSDNEQDD